MKSIINKTIKENYKIKILFIYEHLSTNLKNYLIA